MLWDGLQMRWTELLRNGVSSEQQGWVELRWALQKLDVVLLGERIPLVPTCHPESDGCNDF
jgi:hypothetical protein